MAVFNFKKVPSGFRLITGGTINTLQDAINNLAGGTTTGTFKGTFNATGTLTFSDAVNVVVGTTTGTKIGTATTQKIGFYNATPVVQPATTGTATGFTAGSGTAVNDVSTFTGGTGSTAYRISDLVLALKNLGLLAA